MLENVVEQVAELMQVMEECVEKGYEMMLFHQGLGETCIFSMLLKAYTEKTGKPLLLFTHEDSRKAILEQNPYVAGVVPCSLSVFYTLSAYREFRERLRIKNFEELHIMDLGDARTMREKVYRFLGLSFDIEDVPWHLKSKHPMELERLFYSLGLCKGRTCFLVPYAICFGKEVVSSRFWVKLSSELKKAGYQVVFNAPEEVAPGEPFVYLPIEDVPDFACLCGNVIGVRTGLLDLIAAFTDVKIQAVYPNESCSIWEQNKGLTKGCEGLSRREMAEYHLRNMDIRRVVGRGNTYEFIHGDEDCDIQKMIDHIDVLEGDAGFLRREDG